MGNNGRAILPYDVPIIEAWGIIDNLFNTNISIKKPYNSQLGKIIAKFINMFYHIISLIKKK